MYYVRKRKDIKFKKSNLEVQLLAEESMACSGVAIVVRFNGLMAQGPNVKCNACPVQAKQ